MIDRAICIKCWKVDAKINYDADPSYYKSAWYCRALYGDKDQAYQKIGEKDLPPKGCFRLFEQSIVTGRDHEA